MKHIGTREIKTERLLLRRFKISDAEAMFNNWANDSDVTKYLIWQPHGSIDVTKQIINEWVDSYDNDDSYNWAIVLKENGGILVGSISVVSKSDEVGSVEIGYCMSKAFWHRGIMTEALTAVIKFFFEEVGVNRVESRHDSKNPHSGGVMKKSGMKYEGTLRQADKNNSGICDACYYGILKSEWVLGQENSEL